MKDFSELEQLIRIDEIDVLQSSEFKKILEEHINVCINENFEKLVYLLYRIDVDERKLKTLLRENPTGNTAEIIANLIIERQKAKLITKNQFRRKDNFKDE